MRGVIFSVHRGTVKKPVLFTIRPPLRHHYHHHYHQPTHSPTHPQIPPLSFFCLSHPWEFYSVDWWLICDEKVKSKQKKKRQLFSLIYFPPPVGIKPCAFPHTGLLYRATADRLRKKLSYCFPFLLVPMMSCLHARFYSKNEPRVPSRMSTKYLHRVFLGGGVKNAGQWINKKLIRLFSYFHPAELLRFRNLGIFFYSWKKIKSPEGVRSSLTCHRPRWHIVYFFEILSEIGHCKERHGEKR